MRVRFILFGIAFLACHVNAIGAEEKGEFCAVLINGKKVGYSTHARRVVGGKVRTSEMIDITINRGGTIAEIRLGQSSLETIDGKPINFEVNQKVGDNEMALKGILNKQGKCDLTVTNAGKTNTSTIKWCKDALMAEGLRLLTLKKGLEEGTTFTARVFEPASLVSRKSTIRVGPRKEIQLIGRKAELTEIKRTCKSLHGVIVHTSYVDKDLNSLKVIVPMMEMTCEFVSCSRLYAFGSNDSVDLLDGIVVASPIPLEGLFSAKSITYELTPTGTNRLTLPSSGNQSVRYEPDGRVAVTVQTTSAPVGETFPYTGDDKAALEALEDSVFLQSGSPEIIALAHRVVGNTKDAAKAVRQIERFVYNHIDDKASSIGYAPALDIVASRKGDCSEHAVLTVALCRAVGIPAQVVTGIVYVTRDRGAGVFVPHAWARVYIGGVWIHIDATRIHGFETGHIALAYSNGSPENMLSCLGQFKITRVTVNQ